MFQSLSNLSLTSLKSDERLKASSRKKKIESHEFVLLLIIWENILRSFNLVSKKLQSIDTHLHSACNYLKEATSSITNLREKYEEFIDSANILCNGWGIPIQSTVRRRIYSKRFFDDVDGDGRLDITNENLRVLVFFTYY